jgi:hypothetical protein
MQFNSRDSIIDIVVPLAAIIGGCIMSIRHFRAAFDNINARGGAAGYRFGRVALDSEVLVRGRWRSRDRERSR